MKKKERNKTETKKKKERERQREIKREMESKHMKQISGGKDKEKKGNGNQKCPVRNVSVGQSVEMGLKKKSQPKVKISTAAAENLPNQAPGGHFLFVVIYVCMGHGHSSSVSCHVQSSSSVQT